MKSNGSCVLWLIATLAPFRPRLPSAPGSRPPQARFRPSLPLRQWASVDAYRQKSTGVRRRGASELFVIDV